MCKHAHTCAYMICVSQAQGILNLKRYEDEKGASVKSDKLVDQIRGRSEVGVFMHVLRNSSRLSSVGEETVEAGKKKKKKGITEGKM